MNADWLLARFEEYGDNTAIIWHDQTTSYRQLLDGVAEWRRILASHQIEPGECVAFCGDFSPGATMLLLALLANRNITVALSMADVAERTARLGVACVNTLFEFDAMDGWHCQRLAQTGAHPLLDQLRAAGEAGLVLFSSGSTGQAKAALHSLPRMLNKFSQRRLRAFRTLPFLPLDHVGGFNVLFSTLGNGGAIITSPVRTGDAVGQTIEQHSVELLPTTPTFLNMLLMAEAHKTYDLAGLKVISYGSEPMPPATLAALRAALPSVQLKQTYGLTELGTLSTRSDPTDSQWVRHGSSSYELKVVDGILWVRTAAAMLGYLNAPSPFDEEGWFKTGDAVVDKDGAMRILGRASEIINVGGEKVFPAEVENVLLQVENVKDAIVTGKSNPLMGKVVVASVNLFQPEEPNAVERRVRAFCQAQLAPYKVPAMVTIATDELHGHRFKKLRQKQMRAT